MNKQLISFAVATILATGSAHAGNPATQPSAETYKKQAIGISAGAVAGAVIAGPAGLVAGSILGSLLGWSEGLHDDLDDSREALRQSRTELATLETRNRILVAQAGEPAALAIGDNTQSLTELGRAVIGELTFDLYFRSGSAQIEPFYGDRLDAIASLLNAFPALDIELSGYADRRGQEQTNAQLSSERADAVKARLTAAGVDPGRIHGRPFGESQPVSSPGDAQAYAFDRRVQLQLSLRNTEPDAPVALLEPSATPMQ